MYERVVIATDLSATTAPLLGAIPDLRRLGTREVTLVSVLEPGVFGGKDSARRADYERQLEQMAKNLREQDLTVKTEVVEGFSVQQILSVAGHNLASLVVVGSRGYSIVREVFLGSTLSSLLQATQLPVLVKHLDADRAGDDSGEEGRLLNSVVLATDLTVAAREAEQAAVDLAPRAGRMLLLSVLEQQGEDVAEENELRERLEALAERCRAAGATVETQLASGHPASDVVREVAHERDASLVIIGKHGYSGYRNNVMGGTSAKVALYSERHVLMVPTPMPSQF